MWPGPQNVEMDCIGTSVKVHSPCPRSYIAAAVAVNTTARRLDNYFFYWYGSQSAGLVINKYRVNCKRKKSNTKMSNYRVN